LYSWFKCLLKPVKRNDRNRLNHIASDYGLCDSRYGHSNNIISNISVPQSIIRIREARFFSEKRKEDLSHYHLLNSGVFKHLLKYNKDILSTSFDDYIYSNWNSFELHYDISAIKSEDVFNNALMHIRESVPSFENDVNQIQIAAEKLNRTINNNKRQIRKKVENELATFNLVHNADGPLILHKLQWYWFEKILYGYRNKRLWYNDSISNLEPFDNELKEEEGFLKIGAFSVAKLPIERTKFVSVVIELVGDYEIWMSILDLIRSKEEIGDRRNDITRQLHELVNEINNDRYHVTLECCPSQQC
jgi:hypothetical protein